MTPGEVFDYAIAVVGAYYIGALLFLAALAILSALGLALIWAVLRFVD